MLNNQTNYDTNIYNIIRNEDIITYFHPIISVKRKSIIGFEALSRGIDRTLDEIISPQYLFTFAKKNNLSLKLDRACRKAALQNFRPVYFSNKDFILFLNFDTSILDENIVGSGHLRKFVDTLQISPGNIALEIVESHAKDINSLQKFIKTHREHGFLIALDDIGNGYSNLNRIPLVKPDIIKIDRYLVQYIDRNYHKQAVFKSLVNLSRNIGSLVIAEGVEREEEAITALELGVDMIQGFYFSEPRPISAGAVLESNERIKFIATSFQKYLFNKLNTNRSEQDKNERTVRKLIVQLSAVPADNFDNVIRQCIDKYSNLECVYVLNESGVQVSSTICSCQKPSRSKMPIFRPAPKGEDHSLKDYYYFLINTGSNKYTTEPYISLSSGNLCTTISTRFTNVNNKVYILCADFIQ